ncbi:MAG: hypothetical protein PF692_08220 [Kiritimatiellae bacterium]|jgi:hypothetical protein|nr:hypothetical protein [Kiritimatiellia bacterium]
MKYHAHILKEKKEIHQKLKELDERILILKKSIEVERKKSRLSRGLKNNRKSIAMPSISLPTPTKTNRLQTPQYRNSKNRKLLDNLSSNYNTNSARTNDNYQRNKALIMSLIVILIITWLIYNLTH